MASGVLLAPGSVDPGGLLHDAEVGSESALDDGHTDAGGTRNPVDRRVTPFKLNSRWFRGSHMENSVKNNGSPVCYKGGRRGERSSPISEIYVGVRRRGQDALSDESWEWRKPLAGAQIYRPRGRNEWQIGMGGKFILRMNLGWIHKHAFFLFHIRSAVHPAWPIMGSEQVPFYSTDFVLYHTGCIRLGSWDQSHHQTKRNNLHVLFSLVCMVCFVQCVHVVLNVKYKPYYWSLKLGFIERGIGCPISFYLRLHALSCLLFNFVKDDKMFCFPRFSLVLQHFG